MTVITRLNGGLGNQLFQVAMGLAVAKAVNGAMFLDAQGLANTSKRANSTSRSLEVGTLGWELWPAATRVEHPWWLSIARGEGSSAPLTALGVVVSDRRPMRKTKYAYVKESSTSLALSQLLEDLADKDFVYLSGYWADKSIPELVRDEMRDRLLNVNPASPRLGELQRTIEGSTSLAIHVRRGDFFSGIAPNHGILTPDYFLRGIEELHEKGDQVFFFSDDPDWCKETFRRFENAIIVEPESSDSALDHMLLMSRASKFLLSNSSFSWWSAWLSNADGRQIIRPEFWVNDDQFQAERIYPSSWQILGVRK